VRSNRLLAGLIILLLLAAAGVVALLHLPDYRVSRYRPLIDAAAAKHGVDAKLIGAVIRTESSGNPRAVSSSGAVGLMQLMPATAQEMADDLKMGAISRDRLLDPALNIELGTCYLAKLQKVFNNDLCLVLAAYNAGPTQVRKWQAENPSLDSAGLVEHAAFPETRDYVRKVTMRIGR
jgi:soluble lytic murein transglycosylase